MHNIKIFTEAGYNKGFGHYYRMTSIGECACRNGIPFQMVIDGDEAAKRNLAGDSISFFEWQGEKRNISSVVDNNDIVVVDSYNVSLNKLSEINDLCARMIVIDDNKRLEYMNMNILNPNYYGEFMDYPEGKGNKYYLGKDYTLLREAFRSPVHRTAKECVEDILITMGGTDAKRKTEKCMRLVREIDPNVRLHIVATSAYKNLDRIKTEMGERDQLFINLSPEEMSEKMRTVDFAIASAGGTSNELIKTQCPAILIVVADNQVHNAEIMSNKGCFLLSKDEDAPIETIFSREVRQSLIDKMKRFYSRKSGSEFVIACASQYENI